MELSAVDAKSFVKEQLTSESWNFVFDKTDPNSAWDNLKTYLKDILNQHAPKLEKRLKGKISPWITSEIKAEMNKRDYFLCKFRKSKSESDHKNFKCQRTNSSKRKKGQYLQDQLNDCANEPKEISEIDISCKRQRKTYQIVLRQG